MSPLPADSGRRNTSSGFRLSPLQRRLRVITAILLAVVSAMVVFSMVHPFFRFRHPVHLTPEVRHAIAVHALLVLAYWTVCFCLVLAMLVVAWLDIREVRRQLAQRRLDILNNLSAKSTSSDTERRGP